MDPNGMASHFPFSNVPTETVADLGEAGLIKAIREWLGALSPPAPFGIGDDAAVLRLPTEAVSVMVTTDSLVYECHFDATVPATLAGAKLIKRNLSDIAAMGGRPRSALSALLLGPDVKTEWLKAFHLGMRACCEIYGVELVGGDICQGHAQTFAAWLMLWGVGRRCVRRQGARAGDTLWVTGTLGGSRLKKHLLFQPRLKEGQWLAQRSEVHSMIDISDGLYKDLPELIPQGCDAALYLDRVPIEEDAHTIAHTSGTTLLEDGLGDGEDYELLFTVDGDWDPAQWLALWQKVHLSTPVTCIGRIVTATDPRKFPRLRDARTGRPLPARGGYQHL